MKARPQLQQGCPPALDADASFAWRAQVRRDIEQGALPGAVLADDADAFTVIHCERNVPQGIEALRGSRSREVDQPVAQQFRARVPDEVFGNGGKSYRRHSSDMLVES